MMIMKVSQVLYVAVLLIARVHANALVGNNHGSRSLLVGRALPALGILALTQQTSNPLVAAETPQPNVFDRDIDSNTDAPSYSMAPTSTPAPTNAPTTATSAPAVGPTGDQIGKHAKEAILPAAKLFRLFARSFCSLV